MIMLLFLLALPLATMSMNNEVRKLSETDKIRHDSLVFNLGSDNTPMPNARRLFTVLRSPHIDKKAREQFELTTHINSKSTNADLSTRQVQEKPKGTFEERQHNANIAVAELLKKLRNFNKNDQKHS